MCADPTPEALQVLYQVLFILYVSTYTIFIIVCPAPPWNLRVKKHPGGLFKKIKNRLVEQLSRKSRKRRRKRKKKWFFKTRSYLRTTFQRRSLPYHLVLRCYRRQGNRPPRLPEYPSRNWKWIYAYGRRIRRKRRKKQRKREKAVAHAMKNDLQARHSCQAPLFLSRISEGVVSSFVATLDGHGLTEDHPLNWSMDRVSTFRNPMHASCIMYHASRICLLTTSWLCAGIVAAAPLVFDTGASFDITPYRSDFLTYTPLTNTVVQGVNAKSQIKGVGLVLYKLTTRSGRTIFRVSVAYHMPDADIRLLSPQVHMRTHGGSATVDGNKVVWHLPPPREGDNWVEGDVVDIPIDPRTNLPMVNDFLPSAEEVEQHGDRFVKEFALVVSGPNETAYQLDAVDCSGVAECGSESPELPEQSIWTCLTVADPDNMNLQAPAKELLRLHWRYGINMSDIQELLKPRTLYDEDGVAICVEPPVLKSEYKSTATCKIPVCRACQLANQRARSTETSIISAIHDKVGSLSRGADAPGKMVHTDQMVVSTPGRLLKGYGREGHSQSIHGATTFSDAYSRYKSFQLQVSLNASETIDGKSTFEREMRDYAGVDVKHYRSDNGIFDSTAFRQDCKNKNQSQSFSAVGAKHQNSVAESDIRVIGSMARHFMVHASVHWPDTSEVNARLWTFAVVQAVYIWNRLPKEVLGYHTPIEMLSGLKSDHRELRRIKTWGVPCFVLSPTIQDGKKLPKFNRRSRLAQHLGVSTEYSSLTGVCRNLRTNYASPQFHVVYDELFTVIRNDKPVGDAELESIFGTLFETVENKEFYGELPEDVPEEPTPSTASGEVKIREPPILPPLRDEYLTEAEIAEKQQSIAAQREQLKEQWKEEESKWQQIRDAQRVSTTPVPQVGNSAPLRRQVSFSSSSSDESDDDSVSPDVSSEGAAPPVSEGASSQPPPAPGTAPPVPPAPNPSTTRRSQRSRRGDYNRSTRGLTDGVSEGAYTCHPDYPRAYASLVTDKHIDKSSARANPAQYGVTLSQNRQQPLRMSRKRKHYKARLAKKKIVEACYLARADNLRIPSVEELMNSDLSRFVHLAAVDHGYAGTSSDLVVEWLHPLLLAAKNNANKEDYPTWWQAMNGPFAEEYWKAAVLEVETLEEMDTWNVVERTDDMKPLPVTWALRAKRYPDGLLKKMKARLCARGDLAEAGVHYFDESLYAPVVQWTTVRILLILECILGLKSKQGDIKAAFLHSKLDPDEEIYLEMPQGFKQYGKNGRPKVLRLNRRIYGLKDAPKAFFEYLKGKMEECGMRQSEFDPCLFIGDTTIAVVFVDDVLMWSRDEANITALGMDLRQRGVDLEEESDSAGFLGIDMKRVSDDEEDGGKIVMTQQGLVDRILLALGLDENSTPQGTPCMKAPLVKDEDGDPPDGSFSYSSVVGMLLYLANNTRPDLAYSVHCAARFSFCPKKSHEQALKRIGKYLKGTRDKGMVITPNANLKELKVDAFPDSDFGGLYGYEDIHDPVVTRSRTGLIINLANSPVLWKSQLQSQTATSTMEAEINAMATCCRELFPILDVVKELSGAIGLSAQDGASMHIRLHEDNAGALILAKTIPPEFTPRSKHYAIKTNWFREQIVERGIQLIKCDTKEMLGDIFTKCLPQPQYEYLRNKIMGWEVT